MASPPRHTHLHDSLVDHGVEGPPLAGHLHDAMLTQCPFNCRPDPIVLLYNGRLTLCLGLDGLSGSLKVIEDGQDLGNAVKCG